MNDPTPSGGESSIAPHASGLWLRTRRLSRPAWILLHSLCLALLGIAWLLDEPAARVFKEWYGGPIPISGELHQLILSLAMFGQMLGITVALALMLIFDVNRRGRIVVLGAMLLVAGLGSSLLKASVGRERPLESKGRTIIRGPWEGFRNSGHQSFPSGHTATAVALAYGLSRFYPQSRLMVWVLAYGVGLNRVITVRHFPSDVVAGAWFGYTMAALMFGTAWVWRLAALVSGWLKPSERSLSVRRSGVLLQDRVTRLLMSPALLVLVSFTIAWAGNGSSGLWDRDEPRFGTATREMQARGDWIVPTFNGQLRPDKPILIYWLMGGAYSLFGDGEFGARFFSGIGAGFSCLMVFLLGRKMFDRRVGLLAGWMLALSPMLIIESKLATVDALLLFELLVCFWSVWRIYTKPTCWKSALSFWIGLSLAILTKGPVAVGILGTSLLAFCLMRREFGWLSRFRWHWGLPLAIGLISPWCVAVQLATEGEFLRTALGHHVITRSIQPLEGHRGFPGFYVISLFALMAPWAWLIPWTLREHWKRFLSDSRLTFLAAQAIAPLIMFELIRTKLVHYYLPAYPAIVLLISSALLAKFGDSTIGLWRFDYRLGSILIFIGTSLAVGTFGFVAMFLPEELKLAGFVVAVIISGGMILTGFSIRERQLQRAFIGLCSSIVSGFLVAGAILLPGLSEQRVIVHVARRMKELGKTEQIALWHYCDPSLVYNFGTQIPHVDPTRWDREFPESLALAQKHGHFICPMREEDIQKMSKDDALRLHVFETISHFDLSSFDQKRIHLVSVHPAQTIVETGKTKFRR